MGIHVCWSAMLLALTLHALSMYVHPYITHSHRRRLSIHDSCGELKLLRIEASHCINCLHLCCLPILQFILVMTEAIYLFSRWSSPIPKASRPVKTYWHWILQLICTIVAFTGLAAIVSNKMIVQKQHFTTWHGTIGIVACISLVMQLTGGVLHLYPDIMKKYIPLRLVTMKRIHAFFGTATYSLGLTAVLLATRSTWFLNNIYDELVMMSCAACPIILFSVQIFQFVQNWVFR